MVAEDTNDVIKKKLLTKEQEKTIGCFSILGTQFLL